MKIPQTRNAVTVALLGSSKEKEDSPEAIRAKEVGRLLAVHGAVLLTGGCTGIPHAAALGAREAGGLTVAVSPARNREEHRSVYGYPQDSDVFIFTGMGAKGRNVILVRSAHICIFATGGMGTLNEFTIAFDEFDESRAIGVLGGSGGLTGEFPRLMKVLGERPRAFIVEETDPGLLVNRLLSHVSAHPFARLGRRSPGRDGC